ncbi:MAG TPA: LamG-like jellyroll fold domain-containing protein [Thermoanaerobaculia bacterium]|jgi:Tol biopolymer transport system component
MTSKLPPTAGVVGLTIQVTPTKPANLYCLYVRNDAGVCAYQTGTQDGTSALYVYDFDAKADTEGFVKVTDKACLIMGDGKAFGVNPSNPNETFLSQDTEGRRYTYAETGTTYVKYASAYSTLGTYHPDIEALVPHPTHTNEVWMCHHGGVSVSTDNGATWSDRSAGLGVAQVMGMADSSSDPGYVAVGLFHDGTVITAPPWYESWSPHWTHVLGGDGARPMIAPTTPQYMWGLIFGPVGRWQRSANYGSGFADNGPASPAWTMAGAVFDHLSPSTQYRIAAQDTTTLNQTIRRTTDWGATWPATPISDFGKIYPSFTLKYPYSPPNDGNTLLVEVNDGQDHLFRTKQANAAPTAVIASWEELPLPPYPRVGDIEFDPSNPDILYLANSTSSNPPDSIVGKDLVIRGDYTDPKQVTFQDLTQNLPNATAGDDELAITTDGTGGLYYACDFGVFYSNEATRASGQGWTPFGTALPNTSYSGVAINNVNHKVRVAAFGRGVWEHDLAATISGTVFQDLNHDATLDAGEPPLTGWTVTLTSAAGAVVSSVTDANGRYTFSALAAGGYQIDQALPAGWAQTLPSGRYSVQVTAGQWLKRQDFGNDKTEGVTCAPPPADMTGWWRFNESASSTVAHDDAGVDNAGMRVGNPQLVNGKVASAFHFDGSTQYIQVATHPEVDVDQGNFSIHAWVRTSRAGLVPIVDKRSNPVLGYSFFLFDGRLGVQMADRPTLPPFCSSDNTASACTNWFAPVGSPSAADGQWHHVAVTVDRDTTAGGVLYVDGVPVLHFDPTVRAQSLANTAPLLIGTNIDGNRWQGEIDEVSLFKRALSPYDVASVYKAGSLGQCPCTSNYPAHSLQGGKVAFVSDRVTPPQVFVQQVGLHAAPLQLTTDFYGARHPRWFPPNGNYIAYIRGDVSDGNGVSDDELAVTEEANPSNVPTSIHASTFDARNLGYPQWSDDGASIVVLFTHASGLRGLGLVQFPFPAFSSPTVTTLLEGDASLNPGEPVFSHDGKTVYFAADTPSASAALFKIPTMGGTPIPVLDQYGTQVHLLYAPSMSPGGNRLMFNSEMWREQPAEYQDEEVLELDLASGVIKRITAERGNQYGWFAKNGKGGEFLLQSNNTAAGTYALYLQANGVRIPFDVGAPQNQNQSGDWWKAP